jgi:Na+/H+-dicarboxylate symporter
MTKRIPSSALGIVLAILAGSIAGRFLGAKAAILGEIGLGLIQLLKILATPLIFFVILDTFCKTQISVRDAFRLFSISLINAGVAGGIAIGIAFLFPFRGKIDLSLIQAAGSEFRGHSHSFSFSHFLKTLFPESIFEPFIQNNIISVVLFSILIGIGIKSLKKLPELSEEVRLLEGCIGAGLLLSQKLLFFVVKAVPLAIFGVIAKIIGVSGFHFFPHLIGFLSTICAGFSIQVFIYYSFILLLVCRRSPFEFAFHAFEAWSVAFGTGSSLATLPITLRTLQDKMKVSLRSSRLAACIGTNLNHDGILLYEAATALFIAQVYGISLGISQKILLLFVSALAAIGIAGVPDAGLITLSLVLSAVGLPLDLIPVLMTVDWLMGRLRAVVNVTTDMVVATVLDSRR